MKQDLTTSGLPSARIQVTPLSGWYALHRLLDSVDLALSVISQAALLFNLAATCIPGLALSELGRVGTTATFTNTTVNITDHMNGPDTPVGGKLANSLFAVLVFLAWPLMNKLLARHMREKREL